MAYGENTNLAVGTGSGMASGAMMGAMMGSAVPGVGTVVGMLAGGALGAVGALGSNKAAKAQREAEEAQRRAIEAEMRRRAAGVGLARQQFGDVWSFEKGKDSFDPSGHQDLGKTILRHGQIAGGLESHASAVRDAGMQQLAGGAQQAKADVKGSMIDRGLLGSSLGEEARKMLLAEYAGGRSTVAGATEGARDAGWQGLRTQQQGYESLARGGQDISGQMRAISTAGAAAGARGQLPVTYFGNLLNTGIGVLDAGARSEASGGAGLTALGLPALGLARGRGNTATGATTSTGRV